MRYKFKVFVCFLSFLYAIGFLVVTVIVQSKNNQNEKNTTELIATIKDVQTVDTNKEVYYLIHVEEYRYVLNISTSISRNIDDDLIGDLNEGDIIYFRVENEHLNQEDATIMNIVSLKTDDYVAFSLDDYNQYISVAVSYTVPVGMILIVFFMVMGIALARKHRGRLA